jgi:hypothetical protein
MQRRERSYIDTHNIHNHNNENINQRGDKKAIAKDNLTSSSSGTCNLANVSYSKQEAD